MIPYEKLQSMPYGGDYNPEQWPEETWEKDMELLEAAGINTLTLNVFSWAAIQPSEDVYDFSRLDRIVALAERHHMHIVMATSTGAMPAWMAHRHPDILRVDREGRKRRFGGRHNCCPNSPTYLTYAPRLAEKLALQYRDHESIVAWHISNEFGGECYCENCEKAFRTWLKGKYQTIANVNAAWDTAFWGHTFYDWDEIVAPSMLSECGSWGGRDHTMFQTITLDYKRFLSDSMLHAYDLERDAIKKIIPGAQCTTNMMGAFPGLDYQKWAQHEDFVSWDNYPSPGQTYAEIAMPHDLMRGVGGQKPFLLMEQTPSVTNWQPYNALKRPGIMRLWSYQAIAHGSDSVMFFQMKRSIGNCEKYHGAVIDHVGTGETRVYREVASLGEELKRLGPAVFAKETKANVALIFDWDTWWSSEASAGPTQDYWYRNEILRFYEPLRRMKVNVDIIGQQDDFSGYRLVIAPVMYMVKPGVAKRLERFVQEGGTFVTTYFSGFVNEHDLVTVGGYPGELRQLLGIWVEEEDALPEGAENHFTYHGVRHPARMLCDLVHLEGAAQLDGAGYEEDFYWGMPVVTRNAFGGGQAYYVATASNEGFYRDFLTDLLAEAGTAPLTEGDADVEVTTREDADERLWFYLNHADGEKRVNIAVAGRDLITGEAISVGERTIAGRDVLIVEESLDR